MRTAALILAGVLLAQDPAPPDDPARRAERLKNALLFYSDADPGIRDAGRKELVALGKHAVMAVEDLLGAKGGLDLANLLREIDRAAAAKAPAPSEAKFVTAAELPIEAEILKGITRPDVDKYVRAKLAEALSQAKKGNYQRGFDLSKALETLEPKSPVAGDVKLLRRHCENMITQTTLLEAKLFQDRAATVVGEPVELTMRLRNLYKSQMTLTFDKAAGFGQAVFEIEATITDLYQAQEVRTGSQVVKFEAEIPIATGAQWEKKIAFAADLGFTDQNEVRVFAVNAWMQPLKIETDGKEVTRKIQFQPAVIRMVPAKYRDFVGSPLEWLGKTIDTGRPAQETYVCAQLLDGDQKDMGIEVLIRAMEKTSNLEYRKSMAAVLGLVTGEKHGYDPKKWSEWHASRGRKPK